MFFEQLLGTQLPKAQEDIQVIMFFFAIWGSSQKKLLVKHWGN